MFYMVYVEGQSAPTKRYTEIEAAKSEAARLCQKQGSTAYVLAVVASCTPPNVIWTT